MRVIIDGKEVDIKSENLRAELGDQLKISGDHAMALLNEVLRLEEELRQANEFGNSMEKLMNFCARERDTLKLRAVEHFKDMMDLRGRFALASLNDAERDRLAALEIELGETKMQLKLLQTALQALPGCDTPRSPQDVWDITEKFQAMERLLENENE